MRWIWFDDEIEPPKTCPLPWFKEVVWVKNTRDFLREIETNGLPGYIDFDYYLFGRETVMDALYLLKMTVEDDPSIRVDEFYYNCHSRDLGRWAEVLGVCGEIKDTLASRGFKETADD